MAILTREAILEQIKAGRIKIKPFSKKSIGPASIDFHLGSQFRVFRQATEIFHGTFSGQKSL